MGGKPKKGSNRLKSQPTTSIVEGKKFDPKKFYLIDPTTGFVREVSALDFAVRLQANKMLEEQEEKRKKDLDLKRESEGTVEEVIIDRLNPAEDIDVAPSIIEAPRVRIGESVFDKIKPVALDGNHQILMRKTIDNGRLDSESWDHFKYHGDYEQMLYAISEGIRRGFAKSREDLGFRPSGERI